MSGLCRVSILGFSSGSGTKNVGVYPGFSGTRLHHYDQDEYLQLWNYYDHLNLTKPASKSKLENMKSCISTSFPDYTKNEIALAMKIHGIYKSNSSHDDTFVSIKTAKFNHSCNANAIRIVMRSVSRNIIYYVIP